jgi:uncharacterized protein (TIGR03437 family)
MLELIWPSDTLGLSRTWPGIRNSPWLLCLFLVLSASGIVFAQTPQSINIVAVTRSADFQPGLPQAGSLSSIFVTGLQGEQGIITGTKYPLSNELNGVSVLIDSIPAPILAIAFFSGYQQINVQVPWEDATPKVVQVAKNGVQAQTSDTGAEDAFKGVFVSDANGYGVVQHASDYSLVTTQNPAHPGEYLIAYSQNLGPVTNQPPTGALAPYDPLAESIIENPSGCVVEDVVQFGSLTPAPQWMATPTYKGLTPGTVGLYQVNFQLPSFVALGDLPMTFERNVFAGGALSSCSSGLGFSALRRNLTGFQPDGLSARSVFRLHSAV